VTTGKKRYAVVSLVALSLAVGWLACAEVSGQDPILDFSKGVHFEVYAGGHIYHSGELSDHRAALQQLRKLLHHCSGKWRRSLITYAPGIAFKTANFSIMMQQGRLIVNAPAANANAADAKGKWVQVICDIPPERFAEMNKTLSDPSK
jgi:hypothetical protein